MNETAKYYFSTLAERRQVPVLMIAGRKAQSLVDSGEYKTKNDAILSVIDEFNTCNSWINEWVHEIGYEELINMSQVVLATNKDENENFNIHEWEVK